MATAYRNLSTYDASKVPSAVGMKVGIVVAEWNEEITYALLKGACETLVKHGVKEEDILIDYVPGTFELIYGSVHLADTHDVDAIIAFGCVVRGETPHFDYICDAVTKGLTDLNLQSDIPFIFGVLTTNDMQQALDRAGGKYGNKGDECAIAAIKMVDFSRRNLEE